MLLNHLDNKTGIHLIDAIRLGNGAVIGDVLAHAVLPGDRPRPADRRHLPAAGAHQRHRHARAAATWTRPDRAASASSGWCATTRTSPALIPIITVIGLQIALLLGGAVLTETTFEWKGLGFQLVQYLLARDFVAVQGIVALLAVIVALTNFIVDIMAAIIDPRVRY